MCQILVDLDKFDCGHDHATAKVQRGGCRRRPCSNYEPVIRFGNPRYPCDSCGQDENNLERPEEWVNIGRGRVRGCPTRYGEDDARDYTELIRQLLEMLPREMNEMRAEHRFHVEFNGRDLEPDLAGLGPRLPRGPVGVIAAALRNLFDLAPLPPPFNLLAPPPMRHPIGRGRRREQLYRQSQWSESEFSSANVRANFSARAEYRNHRDDEDGYFDWDNDSTTFYDPYDMPLGPRVRFH